MNQLDAVRRNPRIRFHPELPVALELCDGTLSVLHEDCRYHAFLVSYDWDMAFTAEQNESRIWTEWHRGGKMLPHDFESSKLSLSIYMKSELQCKTQPCFGCYIGEWYLIWEHAIQCNWGACYNTMFKYFIHPEFNSPMLLDAILRSRIIWNKPNVIVGKTGSRSYPDLLKMLQRCECEATRKYLVQEFGPQAL